MTSNSTQPDLKANSRYGFDAALFEMTFVPGGGSLLSWSTGLYVTSGPDATYNVVASSNVPSFWETFALVSAPQTAADSPPEYLIRAGANGRYIKSQATGLINSITAEADASRFRLVAPPAPEGAFLLIDKETGKYVSSTQNDPVLSASALTSGAASTWVVSSGDDNATMQLLSTLQYVSATPSKVDPLSCDRFVARYVRRGLLFVIQLTSFGAAPGRHLASYRSSALTVVFPSLRSAIGTSFAQLAMAGSSTRSPTSCLLRPSDLFGPATPSGDTSCRMSRQSFT